MIAVDASVLTAGLVGDSGAAEALGAASDGELNGPELLVLETTNALRKLVRRGHVGAEQAGRALDLVPTLPIALHSHRALLPRVWEMRDRLSAYDASYVALAEALGGKLLTADAALAEQARAILGSDRVLTLAG